MPRRRPIGQPTRGKTALNRLRQIDVYVAVALANVLHGPRPLVVDVGYGAAAWTTLEMRARWLPLNPDLRVLGLEIDPERVAAALPYAAPPALDFKLGGFNVADHTGSGTVAVIRAYNVLRQYEESAVGAALAQMGEALRPGGILIEGTSTPSGRWVAFDVYEKVGGGLAHRALVFGTNFRTPTTPVDFQTILPKRLIHHALDPDPAAFFAAWARCLARVRGVAGEDRRRAWVLAAHALRSAYGYPIDRRDRILRRGFLPLFAPLRPPPLP